MFEPNDSPRLFGLPPGADFPRGLINGLEQRLISAAPDEWARVEIYVNTRRMQRRLKALFASGPPRLLPRIRLVTDLSQDLRFADIPPPASPLRRRLELTQLVGGLLDAKPDLAPRSALYDLADNLAALMDEMQGEGVAPDALRKLDVGDQSGHWQRSLDFVGLVDGFFDASAEPDIEARQRLVIERLARDWAESPPDHPVIVAGSTGSRGATAEFMRLVAGLPQGAVVLPGVDFEMPGTVWQELLDDADGLLSKEDHPQYRFARLCADLDVTPRDIARWSGDDAATPARNRLVSLALRPAPVTDQWLVEGPRLDDLAGATAGMTLIEAESSRAEASAVALVLRQAAEQGRKAALITPDRVLTRQVEAALDRWGIRPDDSAGRPLPLSAPGRLLRHVAELFGQKLTAETLLTLLKHPLTHSGGDRGPHLLHTRELELWLRRFGAAFPGGGDLIGWAEKGDADRQGWAAWLVGLLAGTETVCARPLVDHLSHHLRLAEALAAGPSIDGSGALWLEAAGIEARARVDELQREAGHGGTLLPHDYASLFHAVLRRGEVRDAVASHPDIMIWGTLEARVQGADLVILSGLNEGVWPEPAKPDPWLNRALRHRAGLLLPERQIGLAAHDFQQAVAAPEVMLTRAIRDAEAQTVPSRWLNRLNNLLGGLPEGAVALRAMRERGAHWLAMADLLDTPVTRQPPAPRPSPQPPVTQRPNRISITEVQTLIRDPYAVYARRILELDPLDPLRRQPDPPLRGTILHRIVERFVREAPVKDLDSGIARLMRIADEVLLAEAAWPATRRIWRARIARIAEWFVTGEISRQADRAPIALECRGELTLADIETVLYGKADRIDRLPGGDLAVYDYKTGSVPSADQQKHFDKQLLLAALMAERGAWEGVAEARVAEIAYIGLGATPKFGPVPLDGGETAGALTELVKLLAAYRQRSRGYSARRAVEMRGRGGNYDHLARYGEWDEGDEPTAQEVGPCS